MSAVRISDRDAREALERLIGAETLARIEAPLDQATALPNAAYISDEFLRLENERLFARTWTLAGFAHRIPDPGDAVPVTVAGLPIVLLRNREGEIRAFHNVCRHRGARLVAQPCKGRPALTCPYHAWSYDLEGRLVARPHYHGPKQHERIKGGDAAQGLSPVRCGQWHDLIFVNNYLAPLTARLEGYDLAALRHAGCVTFEVAANWKLAYENYIEPYHVFAVHPRLIRFAPMEIREPSKTEGLLFHNEYRFPEAEAGRGQGLPYYPGLSEDLKQRGVWFQLFPALGIEIYPDQFTLLHVTPLGPERAREEIHIYLVGEAATSEEHREARQGVIDTWRDLNEEDVTILERLQEGRHSSGFDGGRLSPYWDEATRHFAHLVVEGIR
jgi:choline monooxygenase